MLDLSTLSDINGDAVVTIDIPAHTQAIVLAHSNLPGCAVAAVSAWEAARGAGDASFPDCAVQHRNDLLNRAENIYRGDGPIGGDSVMAQFEREVARIRGEKR